IAVANYGTHTIGIFYGFDNGSFEDQIELSTGISRPISIHLVDLNKDTFIDIIIINYGTNSFSVFYGNEIFIKPTFYTINSVSPYSINVGDFNQDTRLDIAVALSGSNQV
ncbi:unnamed protein product, partial [Adineta ricciae]